MRRSLARSLAMRPSRVAVGGATVLALLALAPPAVASPLVASPSKLQLSTPVGTSTEANLTFTNTNSTAVELTGAFLTHQHLRRLTNTFYFFSYDCGERLLAPGESCSYTVVFRPGVVDSDPEPGTVFRGRIVQQTDRGFVTVRFTATAT
jgi:hypothetical protein